MGTGFDISPAQLRQSSTDLAGVVDRLATALTRLETSLQGFGQPWGTGLLGPIIGDLYQGIHDMAMSSFEANAEVMSEYAEGLDGMADTLQELEAQIESGMVDVAAELGAAFPNSGGPR